MTRIAPPLLLLLSSSSLLSFAAARASIFCTWTKVLPNEQVHYSFVRSDPRQASPSSLQLFHSAWSGERALLGCAWSDDAAVIQNYVSLCRERTDEFSNHPDEKLDVSSMLEAEGPCVSVASPGVDVRPERVSNRPVRSVGGRAAAENHQGSEVRSHLRVKRGFIVPGTLWCGSGNKAPSYADLGVFTDTDKCCREHDQCKHTILSFHSEFGVFNRNIFTMSHCDCDNKFRSCLMEANDSISDVVGYTFFNLLKMHCFELSHRLQCTHRNWFAMCTETKMALYAEVHPPSLFESDDPPGGSANSSIRNTSVCTDSIAASASTAPTPSTNPHQASIAPVTNVTTSASDDDNTGKQTASEPDVTEKHLSCVVYKDLDRCRSKILPQQRRYGLYNPETRTLYHCNCTRRLFQTLAAQRHLTAEHALLLRHVSQSCFLPPDCTAGAACTAAVVRAERPRLHVDERRHLQAVTLKVRKPKTRRRDGAVGLHRLCLRALRSKVNQDKRSANTTDRQRVRN